MKLINTRIARNEKRTLGLLTADGYKFVFVTELEKIDREVKGEIRISAGVYPVLFRKELTPLTKIYRAKYSWFTYHLELQNVPNFTNIYINIGNFESSTAACQIIGNKAGLYTNYQFRNYGNTDNFKPLYLLISDALNRSEKVSFEVIDWD